MTQSKKYSVEVRRLQKSYSDTHGTNNVLCGINLNVAVGEFLAIVGPSGCGKSTFYRLMLGQEKPSTGALIHEGNLLLGLSPRRGIVFQSPELFPHMTAIQNIEIGLLWRDYNLLSLPLARIFSRTKIHEIREKAIAYAKMVNLPEEILHLYPKNLSGGQQQRVAIAQAVINSPGLLMLDEPFSALDPNNSNDVGALISRLHQESLVTDHPMTVILVTHDLSRGINLSNRVVGLTRYYKSDLGFGTKLGAKIVYDDVTCSSFHKPNGYFDSDEFKQLEFNINRDVFTTTYLQHVSDFHLKHPDSVFIPEPGEWIEYDRKNGRK
jgi:NitT/TauT family transport system ATP-binding protein